MHKMVRNRKLSYVLNKDYRPDTTNAINITKKKNESSMFLQQMRGKIG